MRASYTDLWHASTTALLPGTFWPYIKFGFGSKEHRLVYVCRVAVQEKANCSEKKKRFKRKVLNIYPPFSCIKVEKLYIFLFFFFLSLLQESSYSGTRDHLESEILGLFQWIP